MRGFKNLLFQDDQPSSTGKPDARPERKADITIGAGDGLIDHQTPEAAQNFRSLTYVSSRGFFFQ